MKKLLFNETLKKLSNFDAKKRYIHENAEIIKFKDFENGCVKIIEQHEDDLTVDEAEACANLLLREEGTEDEESDNDDFASAVLEKRPKMSKTPKYMDLRFILPTSNIVERLFSSAGYAYNDMRKALIPANLEEQIFLKANKKQFKRLKDVSEMEEHENAMSEIGCKCQEMMQNVNAKS